LTTSSRRNRRPQRRQLFCPAHPEQPIEGNGQKYFLHLLTPEQLRERGMDHRKAHLVIEAYPVLMLSDEWLEELFCPQCGTSRWCHITKHSRVDHTVRWAAQAGPIRSHPDSVSTAGLQPSSLSSPLMS